MPTSATRRGLGGGLAGDDATTPCGSLGYAAPEQLSLRRYEREVDLWACGVIAYVLLSGVLLDPSKYEDHLAAEPFVVRLPDEHWAGVSADARDFVLRLLQLDPDKRPRAEALAHPWLQQQGGRRRRPVAAAADADAAAAAPAWWGSSTTTLPTPPRFGTTRAPQVDGGGRWRRRPVAGGGGAGGGRRERGAVCARRRRAAAAAAAAAEAAEKGRGRGRSNAREAAEGGG